MLAQAIAKQWLSPATTLSWEPSQGRKGSDPSTST